MIQLVAFCRSLRLVALALCSATIAVSVTPASARSHHGRHARAYHAGHHAAWHHHHYRYYRHVVRDYGHVVRDYGHVAHDYRYVARDHRHVAHVSRWKRGVAHVRTRGLARSYASYSASHASRAANSAGVMSHSDSANSAGVTASGGSGSNIVAEARRYLGGNPTGRGSLWCARFMNMVLQHSGYRGTGSDMANSFAHYGQRVSGPQVGAIAVMGRRGGSHVGIITGIDAAGNPIMISGNNGNRVREAPVSRGRISTYVMPSS
jgi:uncharacterized protein (TIGR02594 family)